MFGVKYCRHMSSSLSFSGSSAYKYLIFSAFPYSCPHTNSITGQLETSVTLQSCNSDSVLSSLITSFCRGYVQNPSCTAGNDWDQMELFHACGQLGLFLNGSNHHLKNFQLIALSLSLVFNILSIFMFTC